MLNSNFEKLFFLRFSFLLICFATSCRDIYPDYYFPETPVNLEGINSEYDDYNSTGASMSSGHILFSSNRNSLGLDFDIIMGNVEFGWSRKKENFSIIYQEYDISMYIFPYYLDKKVIDSINTSCNEFGPYTLLPQEFDSVRISYFLLANDCSGNFDIQCRQTIFNRFKPSNEISASFIDCSAINTEADELYPCFYTKEYSLFSQPLPIAAERILFCSDRNGQFDLFEYRSDTPVHILDFLSGSVPGSPAALELNSKADDKCPYIYRELLVFTSNRPGGYGGFDLYYSVLQNGSWTSPQNFGPLINSEYNEYRPIVLDYQRANNVMIFSSDRPGGKGGYDLYCVGVNAI